MLHILLLFAEILASRQKLEEAMDIYKFIQGAIGKIQDKEQTVYNTYLLQLMGEAQQKSANERTDKHLKEAVQYAEQSVE